MPAGDHRMGFCRGWMERAHLAAGKGGLAFAGEGRMVISAAVVTVSAEPCAYGYQSDRTSKARRGRRFAQSDAKARCKRLTRVNCAQGASAQN